MKIDDIIQEFASAVIAIFMMLAFVPVFQALNVGMVYIALFVIAVVVIIIVKIVSLIQEEFY